MSAAVGAEAATDWLSEIERAALAVQGAPVDVAALDVDALHVRRFALTVGEDADGEVAPPLYLACLFGLTAGPPDDELRSDGLAAVDCLGLPLDGGRIQGAGQSVEIGRDVVAGERITVRRTLAQVERKHGRSGEFLLVVVRRDFLDERGHPVCACDETFFVREGA